MSATTESELITSQLSASYQLMKLRNEQQEGITPLCVCESAAGYYIGTWSITKYEDMPKAIPEPYSRDSGYYPSFYAAAAAMHGKSIGIVFISKPRDNFTLDTMPIRVDGQSPLANQFPAISGQRTKEEASELYEQWLREEIKNLNESVLDELIRIKELSLKGQDIALVTNDAGEHSHANVIIQYVTKSVAKHILTAYND